MNARVAVRATANFERNLASIRDFLSAQGAQRAFQALVARLEVTTIPALERFPDIGATFTRKAPLSREGRMLFEQMAALSAADGEVRQLVEEGVVILYLHRGASIFLLSIKHHRQLSFDFAGHWP